MPVVVARIVDQDSDRPRLSLNRLYSAFQRVEVRKFRTDKFGDCFCTLCQSGYQFPARLRILIQKDDTTALAKKILDDRGSDSRCAAITSATTPSSPANFVNDSI